ncbi:MAG TPA: sulfide/dihydroorotate dehydrogenase-like FAD/NAD-binding protein [Bacteroidales bacterium]|nr:sulfide/dihydroorotate dehydrogenase-like FAD/NAD-binding protein [Bacteroidales bacterium]
MNRIIDKQILSENVIKLVIESSDIARKRKAGHFVIIRLGEKGERIPLTISSANPTEGTISVIIQKVGLTSQKVAKLEIGDKITDVVGPLGHPAHIQHYGTVICAGGGVGIAPLLPIAEALHKVGNKVISVLAARSKDLIILEDEMRAFSDETIIMTDDGSYGEKGLVTAGMEKIIKREKVDMAVIIGPAIMMKFASLLTKKYDIPSMVSLNTIMVDGTGMCGACRLTIGGKTKFVCVDGPEFDAHQVDFDELIMRLGSFKNQEDVARVSNSTELPPLAKSINKTIFENQ